MKLLSRKFLALPLVINYYPYSSYGFTTHFPSSVFKSVPAEKIISDDKRSSLSPIGFLWKNQHVKCSTSLFSSSATTSNSSENVDSGPAAKKKQKPYTKSMVVVNRGRQSMAFRQGSPLVFSGAISNTLQIHPVDTGEATDDDQEGLRLGSLVAVAVNSKDDRQGNNRGNRNNRRNGKNQGKEPENVYVHSNYYLDSNGNVLDQEDDAMENIRNLQIIGYGVYNPNSMYRVRILCHETSHPTTFQSVKQIMSTASTQETNDAIRVILKVKMEEATRSRESLGLPNETTDSYRLLNGEGDGLSGLAVDVLGGKVAVVMSSAAWCEIYKVEIMDVLNEVLNGNIDDDGNKLDLVWRTTPSRLTQDGYDIDLLEDEEPYDPDRAVIATESGIQYKVFPWARGQKTGFYCDQRENRLQVAQLCENKRVLDLCCYNGGFALNAMKKDAQSCVGVDSSQDAIDAATENAKLNDLGDGSACTFIRDDITNFMKEMQDRGDTYYDVIILDPPKLAPSASGLERASRKYQALNRDAMKLIDPVKGGILLTCTCSGAMTQKDGGQFFLQTVKAASLSARRQITLLRTSGAAACHTQCPASFPAGAYLTAALFHVSPLDR